MEYTYNKYVYIIKRIAINIIVSLRDLVRNSVVLSNKEV